jgi:D-alanyl-D-alanine dipeptidase
MDTHELVDLRRFDPRLRFDIRYAADTNFSGRAVYPSASAWLHRDAAQALRRAHDRVIGHGYGLLVFDAYRPWHITRAFWESFPDYRDFFADPAIGSVHNRGCAVDVSLFDPASGDEVEMTSGYDEFTERAYPDYAGGTLEQVGRRELLRVCMEAEGFSVHPYEWWHYDHRGWRDHPVLDLAFADLGGD